MADLTLTPTGEACQVEGNNDAGVDFVDSWIAGVLHVVDSGIIYVERDDMLKVERAAKELGLTYDIEEGA